MIDLFTKGIQTKDTVERDEILEDIAVSYGYEPMELETGRPTKESHEEFIKKIHIKDMRARLEEQELKRRQALLEDIVRTDVNKKTLI